MIINQDKQEVENLDEFKSRSFGFHKSAKAFQLIIKNIYSNPVKSAFCEILQNARDSVYLAGKQEDTIEVYLPSRLNPEFKVVDFGIGLSHKFMMEKYTLAFYSSKDQNEEMAGGFGCGRLSVLALTSTYNVISVHNGKRYFYSIFINGDGEPEIVTINHEDTSDCNGFTVSCPVLPEHVPQFQEEAKKILKYWKVKPTIKNVDNFVIPKIEVEIEGANWMIMKPWPESYLHTYPQCVAGIYSYDINIANIPKLSIAQTAILQSSGLVLFMGASDVSPQVNRQGLTYDNNTIKNIKAALDNVINDIGAAIQREFDKCTSSWDAKILYHKYFHADGVAKNIGKLLGEKYKVKWNGMEIIDTVFDFADKDGKAIDGIKIMSYWQKYSRNGNYSTDSGQVIDIMVSGKTRLYVNDLDNPNMGVTKRMRYTMNQARTTGNKESVNPYVVTFKNKAAQDLFFEKTLLTPDNLLSIKAIEVPKDLIARSYEKNSKHTSKVFEFGYMSKTRGVKESDSWIEHEIDLESEEGIYIEIEKFVPVNSTNKHINETLEALKHFKLWSEDDILIGIKKKSKQLAEIAANPNWKIFEEYIKGFSNQLALSDEELQNMADYEYFSRFTCEFKGDDLKYLKSLASKLDTDHKISDYYNHLNNYTELIGNYNDINLKIMLMRRLGIQIVNDKKPLIDLLKKQKQLIKLYPLLFENSYYMSKVSEYFFDYVRGVDLKLAEKKVLADEPF